MTAGMGAQLMNRQTARSDAARRQSNVRSEIPFSFVRSDAVIRATDIVAEEPVCPQANVRRTRAFISPAKVAGLHITRARNFRKSTPGWSAISRSVCRRGLSTSSRTRVQCTPSLSS